MILGITKYQTPIAAYQANDNAIMDISQFQQKSKLKPNTQLYLHQQATVMLHVRRVCIIIILLFSLTRVQTPWFDDYNITVFWIFGPY